MIIGGSKTKVIENIKRAIVDGDLNRKVEEGDAELDAEEEMQLVRKFYARQGKPAYNLKRKAMQAMAMTQLLAYAPLIKVEGTENLPKNASFILTANHFNPLDNLCLKKMLRDAYGVEPYIVIQAGNLAAGGVIGDLFNHLDHIPVSKSASYIRGEFLERMRAALDAGRPVLIYPEEEMWFNYRKPRPGKRGAFHFAAELSVPVLPCFVETIETDKPDNDEFYELNYVVHILKPIWPREELSVRQNSIEMAQKDYDEKVAAYEKAYGKKLDYKFSDWDIAGWRQTKKD